MTALPLSKKHSWSKSPNFENSFQDKNSREDVIQNAQERYQILKKKANMELVSIYIMQRVCLAICVNPIPVRVYKIVHIFSLPKHSTLQGNSTEINQMTHF